AFADQKALDYWGQVDVYVGGSEHAVAHLLYSRLWVKILHDLGYLKFDEPFKKLINQGKITGDSRFVYRLNNEPLIFISHKAKEGLLKGESVISARVDKVVASFKKGPVFRYDEMYGGLHVDVKLVNGEVLDIERFKQWKPDFENSHFIFDDGSCTIFGETGTYTCGSAIEKMSKSYFNVVNPDDIVDNYGADTLRMYEMFLGPLEASKPWSTQGIDGVYKFLRRFWNLFHDTNGNWKLTDAEPTKEELKVLHRTLKKIEQDINNFSFNTSVSEFMICANEFTSLKCNKRAVLEPLVIALAPFAPYIAEELWEKLGQTDSILNASFPVWNEQYLVESSFNYPISINGKVRTEINFALDLPKEDIERNVLASEVVQKWTEGKPPKKVIVVPGKIVNVVV
ncbi:MAG: class I tRNA ligase family protein, partial [Cyclobacteriaceae bacterium]